MYTFKGKKENEKEIPTDLLLLFFFFFSGDDNLTQPFFLFWPKARDQGFKSLLGPNKSKGFLAGFQVQRTDTKYSSKSPCKGRTWEGQWRREGIVNALWEHECIVRPSMGSYKPSLWGLSAVKWRVPLYTYKLNIFIFPFSLQTYFHIISTKGRCQKGFEKDSISSHSIQVYFCT